MIKSTSIDMPRIIFSCSLSWGFGYRPKLHWENCNWLRHHPEFDWWPCGSVGRGASYDILEHQGHFAQIRPMVFMDGIVSVVSEGVVGKSNDSRVVFGTGYSESRRESCWEICRIKIWSWWAQTMSHYSVIALLGELSHSSHLQPPIVGRVYRTGDNVQVGSGWDQIRQSDEHSVACGRSIQKAGSNLDMRWSAGLRMLQESCTVVEWWASHGWEEFSVFVQIGGESGAIIVAAHYTSFVLCEFVGWSHQRWHQSGSCSESHEIWLAFYQRVWNFTHGPRVIDNRPGFDHDSSVSTANDSLWVASLSWAPFRRQRFVEGNDSHSSWFKDHRGCSSMCAFSAKD